MTSRPSRGPEGPADPYRDLDAAGEEDAVEAPPGDDGSEDPAQRLARWVMVLAPVILGVLVFLLLRLSTG